MLQLFDNYAATYSLLFIGMVECIGIAWVYGKFARIWFTWTLANGQDLLVWLPVKKFISQSFQISKFRYKEFSIVLKYEFIWNMKYVFWCNLRYEGVFDVLYLHAWDVTFRWCVSSIFEAVWNTSLLHRACVSSFMCVYDTYSRCWQILDGHWTDVGDAS